MTRRDDRRRSWLFAGGEAPGGADSSESASHLGDEELAVLLEDPERALAMRAITEHLELCDACRREVSMQIELAQAVSDTGEQSTPPARLARQAAGLSAGAANRPARDPAAMPRVPFWRRPVPALTGLAVLLVAAGVTFLIPLDDTRLPPPGGPERSSGADADAVRPISPSGLVSGSSTLEFAWTAAENATAYELVVVDPAAGGEIVLRARTLEPRFALDAPLREKLAEATTYHWFVRIERGAGRTRTTPPAAFEIDPGT